jgi:hypothetical protein
MLRYGEYRLLFDTVPEGVLVTVHDANGFVCQVVGTDGRSAAWAAIEAAEAATLDCFQEP